MASERSTASADAARVSGGLANQAYDIGIPAMLAQQGYINAGLAQGGEPGYVQQAFGAQRVGVTEGVAAQQGSAQRQAGAQGKQAGIGGNLSAELSPATMGAQLANALMSSRQNEQLGKIDQVNNLVRMGLGQAGQAGSAGLTAGANQLRAISMLPNYNPNYAMGVGVANLGLSLYGGLSQPGGTGGPMGWDAQTQAAYGGPASYQTGGLASWLGGA